MCSYTCYYVVFHESHDCSLDVCILILLIRFELDLKLGYTTKNRNASTICHLFHNVAIHIIAVLRTLLLWNRMPLWFFVKPWLKNTENVRFEKLNNRFWQCNSFIRASLLYLYKAGYGPTDFLNCVNTTERGCKTWNNDHHVLYKDCISLYDWLYKLLVNFSFLRNFFTYLTSVVITRFLKILLINKVSVVIVISKTFKFEKRSQY